MHILFQEEPENRPCLLIGEESKKALFGESEIIISNKLSVRWMATGLNGFWISIK